MIYTPDNWIIVKLPQCYKVLAGWSGGYLDADKWRLNSGITSCHNVGDYYVFTGHSGSLYHCHKDSYGLRMNTAGVFDYFQIKLGEEIFNIKRFKKEQAQAILWQMPEDTNWLEIDWELKSKSVEDNLIDSGDYT